MTSSGTLTPGLEAADKPVLFNPLANLTLACYLYNPNCKGTLGQFLNKFTILVSGFKEEATRYLYAIAFPLYKFVIWVGSLFIKQVSRPLYINAILIASCKVKVREPCKYNSCWNSYYARYKWKDGSAKYTYFNLYKPKYVPASVAPLPRTVLEELKN
ncbi:uncharacterized protein BDV14DRAFT_207878 [Aspergillus stella-maris]|uniref:uncharacterized protein n=1 Tax=Aspergillus stella-maris TaxID=1810926 RepID=UPI003CCD1DE6